MSITYDVVQLWTKKELCIIMTVPQSLKLYLLVDSNIESASGGVADLHKATNSKPILARLNGAT
jgi:hypothetical protein